MSTVRMVDDLPSSTLRVHYQPDLLRRPPMDLDPAGRSRFDDPEGLFAVRYTATRLRGCLIETMARFRPSHDLELVLADIDGIEDGDPDPTRDDGLLDWLATQQVGTCVIRRSEPLIVDVDAGESLIHLDKHPLVRHVLDASLLGTPLNPVHLDGGVIRLAGPVARPITQAASRAIWEWYPDAVGLAYTSRIDESEQCWALYEGCPVRWPSIVPLSPDEPDHLGAVRGVAAFFEIDLPAPWC